jgi:spore coat polysaccharide biosynthesis predicted glycosyltransferase SpsG
MAEFIAEISSNHNGDQRRCFDLIRAAARCGCQGVKFQLFRINHLFAPEILQVSQRHRERRRWELPIHFLKDLATCCHDEGVLFGCTPFDLGAVDLLEPFTDFLKIASYELPWTDLIRHGAATGQPLMISTGMANARECREAAAAARESGCRDLTVFHCVSNYPVAVENCNLAAIASLKELLKSLSCKVGWSDHSVSPGVIARAVDHWQAEVVEFHFDLEGKGEEFDGGHCWLPEDIGPVIAGQVELAGPQCDGDGVLDCGPAEEEERTWRADPADGLRPTMPVRKPWSEKQAENIPPGPVVIFYPAGMGLGHVSRCLALAEALRRHHHARVWFLIHGAAGQKSFLARQGFAWQEVENEARVLAAAKEISTDNPAGHTLSVVDMLDSPDDLVDSLKGLGFPVVVLDHPECGSADLVVVPSFGWQGDTAAGQVSGGTESILIREDIVHLRPSQAPTCTNDRILVSFGGRDPNRLTEKVIQALVMMADKPAIDVIVGPEFAEFQPDTQKILANNPQIRIIDTGVSLEVVLPGSGLVITALGLTVAEAHVLGLPVALLANWSTDEDAVRRLVAGEMVDDLGYGPEVDVASLSRLLQKLWADSDRRQNLADNGWGLVDGDGAVRVARLICALVSEKEDNQC